MSTDRPVRPAMTMREIREALGHKAPTTVKPIEVGQTYRPTEYNQARLSEDRATVTRVWTPDGQSEQTIAYDIATVGYRGLPSTTHSALAESVFRKSYALDIPEPAPESPADIVARAVALLDSLDGVTYAIVRPDTATTLDVVGRARGMDPAHGVEGLRSMADAIAIRDAQRRAIVREAAEAPAPPANTSDANGQRLRAKAQVLREAADDIESRNNGCTVPGILGLCPVCQTRSAEAAKLRTAATELEQHAAARPATCTCGVPTDTTAVHRADAPCYVKDTDQ
ncbi:hypothetical protein [Streptomyces sp. NPDC088707]|uniref:hypothetical protein n=1 Tax=Streptomyces sp. NPDC088707 TaxID=3365871 RepID=UPI0038168EFD